jgi:hypothetical protein
MVESESSIACPACGVGLPTSELDTHLLQLHQSYAFRGEIRPIPETLAILLAAVCSPRPDVEAWRAFETIAAHECGAGVDAFLATSLTESIKRLPADVYERAVPAVAGLLADLSTRCGPVLKSLAANADPAGRSLAWAVAERAPSLLTREILECLLAGLGARQAIEALQRLGRRTGPHPAILDILREREQALIVRCSRCSATLPWGEMVQHLWSVHGLVLDGRRARDPWEVIDDWIAHYGRRHDAKLLDRCCELAARCDPLGGLERVYRRFLAHGVHHSEGRAILLGEAVERHATLCPRCYAIVPMPEQVAPAAPSLSHGRLSAVGYRVEVWEKGIFPRLEIATPEAAVSRLPLPGPRLTPQGAILFFVGPLVLAALLMAVLPLQLGISPLVPVLTFVLPAIAFAIWIRVAGIPEEPASERALNRAWSRLAPALHVDGYSLADSMFLAGLALLSIGRSGASQRAQPLGRALGITEREAANRPDVLHHLAALRALVIADAVNGGGDPVALTAVQVARCFDGRLALAYADKLLSAWPRDWRTRANLARLRVRLLDRAFEAGFEVRDLLAVGQSAPELGRVLGTDDPGEVARLRLLWSLRPRRPWDRCGDAETAFGLADSASDGQVLGKYPDLLLYRAGAGSGPAARGSRAAQQLEIVVSGRGVTVGGKLFAEPAATIEVRRGDAEHVVIVGDERFLVSQDSDAAATEIERWLGFYFQEFVPMVAEVYRWRSPHAASIVRAWGTLACPECRQSFVARPGEVGIAVEEMNSG